MSSSVPSTPQSSSTSPKVNGHGVARQQKTPPPRESDRVRAKREAKECVQVLGREGFQLDGFNLLGVVANPRAGMGVHSSASRQNALSNAPRIGDDAAAAAGGGTASGATEGSSDILTEAVNSLGYTLGQVTEQIETMNLFIEELSRQYLGDDTGESHFLEYYYQEDEEHVDDPPLPEQLAKLQLSDLDSYVGKCGDLAHSLFSLGLETSSQPIPTETVTEGPQTPSYQDVDVPDIFYDTDFDLTQSATFVNLLLRDGSNELSPRNALYQRTSDLLPAREQDALAGHLDQVELALQEQVRLKAGAFFQETTRFRQLQSSIRELLVQVRTMRQDVQSVLSVYRYTKDISNHQRQDYELLVQLLDATTNLVQTKSSIGGFLSANDQLGAAQQIQYGRRLLKQRISTTDDDNDDDPSDSTQTWLELHNVTALSAVSDQLQQYENLVIQSLSEETVDTFFNWRSSEGDRVKEMIQALTVCQALNKVGDLYNRRLQQTVRMTVRTTIAEFVESSGGGSLGVTGMSYQDFSSCLDLLMEELHTILQMSRDVDMFAKNEALFPDVEQRWTLTSMASGADLAAKSIAELLRLRKEAHSLLTLEEMRRLWDTCLNFTLKVEEDYGNNLKAISLRSTLVGQAKAFLDRTHESHMASLVAALDSERWTPCEVSTERQASLTRLCTGRAVISVTNRRDEVEMEVHSQKRPIAEVEGVEYKVVWSCLLLVEMIMTNVAASAHFQTLATNAVTKVSELLRLFNTRSTQLVLGAGAIHSSARLKSINAKHLSMVTQCLGMVTALLPHIRASLMAQLPPKQHMLLNEIDKIKKEITDHNEKVLNKFVTIIGGIVEVGLAPRIAGTNFDARAADPALSGTSDGIVCCVFLDGVSTNTRKMHQVLDMMLPPEHLQDVFSRIFAYLDNKVPTLLAAAATTPSPNNGAPAFSFPSSDDGKRRLLLEVESMTVCLNGLPGVLPWDFTCTNVLERKMDFFFKTPSTEDQATNNTDSESPVEPSAGSLTLESNFVEEHVTEEHVAEEPESEVSDEVSGESTPSQADLSESLDAKDEGFPTHLSDTSKIMTAADPVGSS